jgi:hypothetical protein
VYKQIVLTVLGQAVLTQSISAWKEDPNLLSDDENMTIIVCSHAKDYFPFNFWYGCLMVTKMAIVAITRHGIKIARRIKQKMPEAEIYVPA